MPEPIRFEDGAAYERGMAPWSQKAGRIFLEWLAPEPGLDWLDVGCGNGAVTELILSEAAPASVHGIDPAPAQVDYARSRPGAAGVQFQVGDALALPFEAAQFDVATMALVLFFVPDPPRGVSEMVRVVRPGGRVAAYVWDFDGGGFPFQPLLDGLRDRGFTPSLPPHPEVSAAPALRALWSEAGLEAIEQRPITVQRTFADFDDFWQTSTFSGSIKATIAKLSADAVEAFKARVRARVPAPDADGRLTLSGTANAIVGRKPAQE